MIHCPNCKGPVKQIVRDSRKPLRKGQEWYYLHHHICIGTCGKQWMPPENERVYVDQRKQIKKLKVIVKQALKVIEQLDN